MDFKKMLTMFLIFIVIIIADIYFEVNYVKTKNIILKSKKLLKGQNIRILHISDFHNKKLSYNKLLIKIKKLNPDIIALTGDIIDAKTNNFDNTYEFLEKLVNINRNTYFVSGNHEWRNKRSKDFIDGLKNRNIKILNNLNEVFTKDTFSINICGIDDPYSKHEDIDKAFNNINPNNFTLLLSHSPNIVFKNNILPCDLILCGHTHGGQVRLPFIGGIIAPGQGFFPKYDKGFYKIEDNTILYINSGLGTSSLPIRFLNRSEICLIKLLGE